MGAVINMAPELFNGVIAAVPFVTLHGVVFGFDGFGKSRRI